MLFFQSEYLDERGVIVRDQGGVEFHTIKKIIEERYSDIEGLYLHKWPGENRIEGTAHFAKDIMYVRLKNSTLYLLRKSEKGKLIEGHDISKHQNTICFNLKKYLE